MRLSFNILPKPIEGKPLAQIQPLNKVSSNCQTSFNEVFSNVAQSLKQKYNGV